MIKRNLGEKIKQLRLEREMSQEELGRLCGVNYRTISSWETNRTEPNTKNLNDLCSAFQCDIETLLPPERDHSLFDDLYLKSRSQESTCGTFVYRTTWDVENEKGKIDAYIEEILNSSERQHFFEYLEKMHQFLKLKEELKI